MATSNRILRLGVVQAALWCAVSAPPLAAQTGVDSILALETFDRAWQIVYDTHFDTTFNGVDWVALRGELRPRAEAAESREALRAVIRDMLERLAQSHFSLIPEELVDTLETPSADTLARPGESGLTVWLLGDAVVVTAVDSGGPAWVAGVRPGWMLTAIGDETMADLVAAVRESEGRYSDGARVAGRVMRRLQGAPGAQHRLALQDGRDAAQEVILTLRHNPAEPVKFGNLPTFYPQFARRRVTEPGSQVTAGVIWFNIWMVPIMRQLDRAVDEFRDLDGIVIDLRGNGGGVGAMVMGVAGHFVDDRVSLGAMRGRTTTLRFAANPRRVDAAGRPVSPFPGPVAVLIDGATGSASEVFAGGLQAIGRVRVFGDTSAGAVLPALMDRLPNGDVLYHAFADFVTATGELLEGRGVLPDEPVAVTRDDLLAGRDPVLEAAMRWIVAQVQHSRR